MRNVIVQELVTVDGFAAGANGELDFFESVADYDEVERENLQILENVDTIVLGAATYRMFVEYWPTEAAAHEQMADSVNSIPKVVFSSTLEGAPWGGFEEARLLRGPAASEMSALKQEQGKDIIVWGSLSLAQSLMTAGLVDEIQLRVIPLALGSGRPLFPEGKQPLGLALIAATPFDSGIVSLRYQVRRQQ